MDLNKTLRLKQNLVKLLGYPEDSINLDFLISGLAEENLFNPTEEVLTWLKDLNKRQLFRVTRIPFSEMRKWSFDAATGDLHHESHRFFSIRGLHVQTNVGPVLEWSQPIIHQPEIGLLGMITKKFNGILHFLIQAKAEPGNVNTFQISPTVQATKSNLMRVHGGKEIPYLKYFADDFSHRKILLDQLQSEQGARFYKKRNRNTIIQLPDDFNLEQGHHFRWVTLGQIKQLMRHDNIINMDARSVISCISYDSEIAGRPAIFDAEQLGSILSDSKMMRSSLDHECIKILESSHSSSRPFIETDQILFKITQQKFQIEFDANLIPLKKIRDWKIDNEKISHNEDKYFSVLGVRMETDSREVSCWDQPIIQHVNTGVVGFIGTEIRGILHFLVQLKLECGNLDILELAPTAQCITGSYIVGREPLWVKEFIDPAYTTAIYNVFQSEEGGRFFQESNRNCIRIDKTKKTALFDHPRYIWMTLAQIKYFLKFSNFLNVEARSLLAAV